MPTSTRDGNTREDEIRLWREGDWWIAKDVERGVTTQGSSRRAALEDLDKAVALHTGEAGRDTDGCNQPPAIPTSARELTGSQAQPSV